jgi:hypothetical protein
MLDVMRCNDEHDECRNLPQYPYVGQNIYFGTNIGPPNANISQFVSRMVTKWASEVKLVRQCDVDKFRGSSGSGHWTQVVWAEMSRVGCAVCYWPERPPIYRFIAFCNYNTGNFLNRSVFLRSNNPGEHCRKGRNPNYAGLCSEDEEAEA